MIGLRVVSFGLDGLWAEGHRSGWRQKHRYRRKTIKYKERNSGGKKIFEHLSKGTQIEAQSKNIKLTGNRILNAHQGRELVHRHTPPISPAITQEPTRTPEAYAYNGVHRATSWIRLIRSLFTPPFPQLLFQHHRQFDPSLRPLPLLTMLTELGLQVGDC